MKDILNPTLFNQEKFTSGLHNQGLEFTSLDDERIWSIVMNCEWVWRNIFFRVFFRWWWGHWVAMEFLNLGWLGCWKWQQGMAMTNGRQWWDGKQWGMAMDTKKDDVWGALIGMTRVLGKMMNTSLRWDQFEPPPMQRR